MTLAKLCPTWPAVHSKMINLLLSYCGIYGYVRKPTSLWNSNTHVWVFFCLFFFFSFPKTSYAWLFNTNYSHSLCVTISWTWHLWLFYINDIYQHFKFILTHCFCEWWVTFALIVEWWHICNFFPTMTSWWAYTVCILYILTVAMRLIFPMRVIFQL